MEKDNLKNEQLSKRCIWTELELKGYSEQQIRELFLFMETLPIHRLSDKAKNVNIMICKGQIVVI